MGKQACGFAALQKHLGQICLKFFCNNRHVLKKWVIISAIPACIPLVAPSKNIEFVPIAPIC
ncbi:hypothetical protein [Janthinobacterium sp. HLX7-2]|uniref:hypothetical protein n=1 Tax=Janthinobacterium sp. HLX7-2 TaxID=1259331 RepID=UPI003F20A026